MLTIAYLSKANVWKFFIRKTSIIKKNSGNLHVKYETVGKDRLITHLKETLIKES